MQEAILGPPDSAQDTNYGTSIAMSGDVIAVGAPGGGCFAGIGGDCGSVYIYHFDGTSWAFETKLIAPTSPFTGLFGSSIAIDGNFMLVGAPRENYVTSPSQPGLGYVIVFEYDGAQWVQRQTIESVSQQQDSWFGSAVALRGMVAAISEPFFYGAASLASVHLFRFDGVSWNIEQTLKPSSPRDWAPFRQILALDDEILAVGTPTRSCVAQYRYRCGAVFLYRFNGTTWALDGFLTPSDPSEGDQFGGSVFLLGDRLLGGAPGELCAGSQGRGAAYLFERLGGVWSQTAKVVPSPRRCSSFGNAVLLHANSLLVADALAGPPLVYAFDLTPTLSDCDCDGINDVCEVVLGLDPDCNSNGVPDTCDIAVGNSTDCDNDGIPDDCELDCNGNLVPDPCDISMGTSDDCNGNGVPDECELQADCNNNGTRDICDVAGGTSLDCNADEVPDECQLGSNDCNTNAVPDDCDIAGGTSSDVNMNNVPDECEGPQIIEWNFDVLSPDRTTRSLRFMVNPSATATGDGIAIKVTMVDLMHPNPRNLLYYPPPNFATFDIGTHRTCAGATTSPNYNGHHCTSDAECLGLNNAVTTDDGTCFTGPACTAAGEGNGCARWVGKPRTFYESQGPPQSGPYLASRLQCTPSYWDWKAEADGLITVVGAEILPSSEYIVQAYAASCMGIEASCANVSAPVTMFTRRKGDLDTQYQSPSPALLTQGDVLDISQTVASVKHVAGAPAHYRAQIQPNLPELNADVNVLDIVEAVDSVKRLPYSFSGPCPCPSDVICGDSCTYCPGLCVKTCTGGENDGEPCINNSHCPGVCVGGPTPGALCPSGVPGGINCGMDGTCTGACAAVGTCRDKCGRCTPWSGKLETGN